MRSPADVGSVNVYLSDEPVGTIARDDEGLACANPAYRRGRPVTRHKPPSLVPRYQ